MLAVAMAVTASASAKGVHILSDTFGAGELSLTEQSGVAVDQGTGDVYVADTGNGRIVKYNAAGESPTTFATVTDPTFIARDKSSGDLYVVEEGNEAIVKLDPAGLPVGAWGTAGRMAGFSEVAGIAVDLSGTLFVMDHPLEGVLHELTSSGDETGACNLRQLGIIHGGASGVNPFGIAVDGGDNVYYTYEAENRPTNKITAPPDCESLGEGEGRNRFPASFSQANGLAVNEADDSTFRTYLSGVKHFSSTGSELEHFFGQGEGLGEGAQLAVRSADETVYVGDIGNNDIAVFTVVNVEPPYVEIDQPTDVTAHTAHFRAEINPEATLDNPGWNVKYRFECKPSCPTGTGLQGTIAAGTETEVVEATAENLLPGTEYEVYITATNAGGTARAPEGSGVGLPFETEPIAPSIQEEYVAEASESTATVGALISPGGLKTGYRVQYVTRSQYEASEFAAAQESSEAFLEGGEGVPVSVQLTGLSSSTTYVARFVAANAIGSGNGEPIPFATQEPALLPAAGSCANEIFRTGPSATLPDCRAFEQASPPNKNGGGVEAVPGAVQAVEGPDAITFYNQGGIPGGVGAQDLPTFISSRGDGSWSTQGLLPPQSYGRSAIYLGLTPDGRYALTTAIGNDASGESLGTGFFRRDLATGEMTTLVPYDPDCLNIKTCFVLAGASADGSRIFFESTLALTGETPPGQRNVFVWEEGSEVSLVDVDEAGDPLPEGGYAGPFDWRQGNLARGGAGDGYYVSSVHAISSDGSEIVFTEAQEEGEEEEGSGQLYVREGIGSPSPSTVKLSVYREGREGPELPAAFLGATPNGRYVFFKSKAELTSDAYAGEGTESLYRYDVSADELVDVTSEAKKKFAAGPGVEGMLGASESGRIAYFVATTALSSETNSAGEVAVPGEVNLFRWEEGAKPPITFIATLEGGNLSDGAGDTRNWTPAPLNGAAASPIQRTARVSADGGSVVFSSHRALTGAPNRAAACNGECAEFFLYTPATRTLDCVSCDPTGARPLGDAMISTAFINASDLPLAYAAPTALSRNLSADGERFFFETPDPLVAADVNGRSGCKGIVGGEFESVPSCLDVYEWEAPGSGTCPPEGATRLNGGCVFLISGGHSDQPSYFADADREGRNAYLFTASPLVPADGDQNYDAYDARESGGLALQHASPPSPCESRQACQGPQASPEASSTPGTANLVAPGNPPVSKKCRKGFVRRHGKCVKKPRHHRKHHRKHHKRKGQKGKPNKKKHAGGRDAKRRANHDRGGRK
ncbi:MAG TPA: hypothetical protein VFK14_12720 [Solirubrobacterales bacterium]|nr:hypothetical protein [Solirubrobacterales bacterium]